MERVKTGIPHLDNMLGGGPVRGEVVLVKGGPGAGKTALGLEWVCRGATDFGEPGAIIVLEETPQQFYRRASAFGWDLRKLEEQNRVTTIFTSAEALSHDILTGSLLVGMLGKIGARRVVVDPITHYRLISQDEGQLRRQVYSTINALRRIGQTAFLLAEDGAASWQSPAPEEYLADAVISLGRAPGALRRFHRLEILKSSAHDHYPHSALFRLTPAGIRIIYPFSAALEDLAPIDLAGIELLFHDMGPPEAGRASGSFAVVEVETGLRRAVLDLALVSILGSRADTVVYLGNSTVSPGELWERARSAGVGRLLQGPKEGEERLYLVEPFGRRCPREFPPSHFLRSNGYGDEALSFLCRAGDGGGAKPILQGKSLAICDLSDILFYLGQPKCQMHFPRLADLAKSQGIFVVGIVDTRLMTQECRAWIENMADGVVRLWEEDGSRIAQVVKGIGRQGHEPRLLIESEEPPFFMLV